MSDNDVKTWCSTCEDDCPPPHHLDGICIMCGEELETRPGSRASDGVGRNADRRGSGNGRTDANAEATIRAAASMMGVPGLEGLPTGGGIFDGGGIGGAGLGGGGGGGGIPADLAALLPPEALDPQAGGGSSGGGSRPASRLILEDLSASAKVLDDDSAELHAASVVLRKSRAFAAPPPREREDEEEGALHLNAIPGDFVPLRRESGRGNHRECVLVLVSPRSVNNGEELSPRTTAQLSLLAKYRIPFVAYVERGDGVTFARKALVCKRAGEKAGTRCTGVIVGNVPAGRGAEVWPYVMKDSKGEASKENLDIPVVMVRSNDGRELNRWASSVKENSGDIGQGDNASYVPCAIRIHPKDEDSRSCPICADSYRAGATVVRLPLCGHVFHEKCATTWLAQHNTCPYCRREFPTDDEEYETERRRVARTHAGGAASAENGGDAARGVDFYG